MEKEASQLERDHVHSVYEKIAPHFNDRRYKAWPKVRQFLLDQEPGSIIADIGGCLLFYLFTKKGLIFHILLSFFKFVLHVAEDCSIV